METSALETRNIGIRVKNVDFLSRLKNFFCAIPGVHLMKGSKAKSVTKMSEQEFFDKLDESLSSGDSSFSMLPDESAEHFIKRIISQ